MKFLQFELSNWALFRSTQIVQFNTTDERPVVLINGENDKGKTSFFYGMRYALFGERGLLGHPKEEYRHLHEWANLYSARDGDGELCVELKIQLDDGSVFRIQRKRKFFQTPTGETITLEQKDQLTIFDEKEPFNAGDDYDARQNWIEGILPYNASQFFLFDGEVIQKYTNRPEQNVQDAIQQVLGLTEIKHAEEDCLLLMDTINGEKTKKARITAKDEKGKEEIELLEQDIVSEAQLLKDSRQELESAQRLIDENNKVLRQYKELVEQKDRQAELKDSIKSDKKTVNEKKEELILIRNYAGLLLVNPLLRIISTTEETPPSKEQWESRTAAHMIDDKHDECVCDTKIDDGISKILKDKILDLKDNPFSRLKRLVENISSQYRPDAQDVQFNVVINQISDVEAKIKKEEEVSAQISKVIEANPNIGEDLKRKEKDNENAMKDIGKLEEYIPKVEKKLESTKGKLSSLIEKINQSTADEALRETIRLSKQTQKTIAVFDMAFREYFKTQKRELEKEISTVFSKLTNAPKKYKGLQLGDDFSIQVERQDGVVLPSHRYSLSAGASQIAATAVIGGFNKFSTRRAPVVIDTPAGRLDPVHTENLLEYYPRMSGQVIILPQKDEIDEKEEELISDFVAEYYDIVPKSDDPNQSVIIPRRKK